MRRYVDMGDRIELMKLAAEFAIAYQMRPVQMYHAMFEAVAEEAECDRDGLTARMHPKSQPALTEDAERDRDGKQE
jgi:hypothetical protein